MPERQGRGGGRSAFVASDRPMYRQRPSPWVRLLRLAFAQAEWDVAAIDPNDALRAVREYLDVLESGRTQIHVPFRP